MIDTNHWRFQRLLQEAAQYRVLRRKFGDALLDRLQRARHDTDPPSDSKISFWLLRLLAS